MANSNGTIEKPVQQKADVAGVLKANTTALTQLATHANINKWSKNKPVKHPSISALTDADRKSVHYGIVNMPLFTSQADMAMFMFKGTPAPMNGAKSEYWTYERPGAGDPKRLRDFDGYWDGAPAPMAPIAASEIYVNHDMTDPDAATVKFDFPVGSTSDKALKISDFDFSRLGNGNPGVAWYFGVCITDGVGSGTNMSAYTGTRLATQTTAVSNLKPITVNNKLVARVEIPYADFMAKVPPSGSVMIFAFVSATQISKFAGPASGGLLVPINMTAKKLMLYTGNVYLLSIVSVSAQKYSSGTASYNGAITCVVSIRNQTNVAQTALGGTVTASKGGTPTSVALFSSAKSIPANSTIQQTVTLYINSAGSYSVTVKFEPGHRETHELTTSVYAPS